MLPLRFISRLNISTKPASAVILRSRQRRCLEGGMAVMKSQSPRSSRGQAFETDVAHPPQDDGGVGGVNQYRKGSFFTHAALLCLALIACMAFTPATLEAAAEKQPFTIDDYFKIKRVTELALSSDGEMVAYAVKSWSPEENKTKREVFVQSTVAGAAPVLIKKIQKARNLAWIPGGQELAFLQNDGDAAQVYSINTKNNRIRQHTRGNDPVTQFRFAPDGQTLAYAAQSASSKESLYTQFQTGEDGVRIDSDTFYVHNFIDPNWNDPPRMPSARLWIVTADGVAVQAGLPGAVQKFHWASDGKRLTVTYIAEDVPSILGANSWASLGLYDVETKSFRSLAVAAQPSEKTPAKYYAGGEWVPGENKIFVRRIIERELWTQKSAWTLVDLSKGAVLNEEDQDWHEIEYSSRNAFIVKSENEAYVNKKIRAVPSLYRVQPSGLERADMVKEVEGSASRFQFSGDFKQAVFVNESLTHPPEIHIWRKGQGSQTLTRLNEAVAQRVLPQAKDVTWKSKDGAEAQGWLLEPVGAKQSDKPWPVITFVHGGPKYAFPDKFADYFRAWPYPLEIYALNGIAVFMPNYRGTVGFGGTFSDPKTRDGAPVDDVVSGIEYLIRTGLADPDRLGISGHSHGGWLAPMVMTRARNFRAGSFADGWSNVVVTYDITPGLLNRQGHDAVFGGSLYDNPARYLELSPELYFDGLKTAALFEAGSQGLAISMMGYPKAAKRAGMPTEFVVYPQTGHNPSIPSIQKESATRNLDWFRFWLLGEEDPDPAKAVQYARWRQMRDERCAREDLDRPSYCAANDNGR